MRQRWAVTPLKKCSLEVVWAEGRGEDRVGRAHIQNPTAVQADSKKQVQPLKAPSILLTALTSLS